MRIFVGGLLASVRTHDLDRLVRELLRGPWYKLYIPRGQLAECELLQLTEKGTHHKEYCALVRIEPHRLGWDVVHRLDGAHLQGRTLHAHRWFPRVGLADRRAMSMNDNDESALGSNRRNGRDRRRALQVQPLNGRLTEAMPGFQRSYGSN